jgi:hypothetical protein
MSNPIFIIDIGPDGVVATHPSRVELPVLVAPVPDERKTKDLNTIRSHLVTIGCLKLPGSGFEFDSSFISPNAERRFTKFADLMEALRQQDDAQPQRFPPISLFGHADPTGSDDYNKRLAGRRALAVYGLLTRDKKIWNELYNIPFGGDRWGVRSIRKMLSIPLKKGEKAFFTGPLESGSSPKEKQQIQTDTNAAVKAYQGARGLPQTGFPGDKTRDTLFGEYMDAICHKRDGQPFKLDPAMDFIARHKDKTGLRGDVQGCGDFNEIFLLSKEQEDLAKNDKTLEAVRNEIYRVDRRVVAYIFKHGTEVDPKHWPCPAAKDGPFGCTLRFWSDFKNRRKRASDQRTFGQNMDLFERDDNGQLVLDADGSPVARPVEETGNTMACRFYHAFAIHSPCERKMEEWIVRFRADSAKKKEPLIGRRFVVVMGETGDTPAGDPTAAPAVIRGTTDKKGEIRIPVLDEHVKMTLKLDAWRALFAFDDEKKTGGGDSKADAPKDAGAKEAAPAQADSGFDTDKFSDEDKFLTFVLDGGALKKMAAESGELPAKQRLYNLGFGQHVPDKWTDAEFKGAVLQYRNSRNLGKGSGLDGQTRTQIEQDHELSDPDPQPDDSDDSGGA